MRQCSVCGTAWKAESVSLMTLTGRVWLLWMLSGTLNSGVFFTLPNGVVGGFAFSLDPLSCAQGSRRATAWH